jgi:spore maturation protein CgeB
MNFVLFYQSFVSCWNHGNAHFLRGVTRELLNLGHRVIVYEPENGWSRCNALAQDGAAILAEAARLVPGVELRTYSDQKLDLDAATDGADVVIVHEWSPPTLIAALGHRRLAGARYQLLFHDTHHRAVSAPAEMDELELDGYDAVLAFGEVLREVYLSRGRAHRVFTWHEAADTALFRPLPPCQLDVDLVWIGNWGDDERTRELEEFLINPAGRLRLRTRIYGVRYPGRAREMLAASAIDYCGWLPNHRAPDAFARARMTVHIPRRPYVQTLPGIPTIRMFEALACGVPLASAPWHDVEGLFPAETYLSANDEASMTRAIAAILGDRDLAARLAANGVRAIRERHTCAHRAAELLHIVEKLKPRTHACDRLRVKEGEGALVP